MRRSLLALIIVFAGSALPPRALAQNIPPIYSTLELELVCDVSGPNVVTAQVGIADPWDQVVRGFVVRRSNLGDCGDEVLFDPIVVGDLATGFHSFQWVDATAVAGQAYRYRVYGTDDAGNILSSWSSSFELVAPIEYATCGDAVIGIGQVTSAWAPGAFQPCPDSCYDWLTLESSALTLPYLDTGEIVAIRGSVSCRLGNVEGCGILVTSVEPATCGPVAVLPSSWGAVKARF